jgi:hypothetical protein
MLWFWKKKKKSAVQKKYTVKERIAIVGGVLLFVLVLNWCSRCKDNKMQDNVQKGIDVPQHLKQRSDSLGVQLKELKHFFDSVK